jgi:DNA polymerase-4
MRDIGMMARTVQISVRTPDLKWFDRQAPLPKPSMIAAELCQVGMELLMRQYDWRSPLRSIGIRGTKLVPYSPFMQTSLFAEEEKRSRAERLEYAVDGVRRRFGYHSLHRLLTQSDGKIGLLDAKSSNTVHPVGYS